MNRTRYYHIRTFGCQMNDYDSLKIARQMEAENYQSTDDPAMADLILINTCSIREKAFERVFGEVGRLKPYKDANPECVLVVAGCVAQQEKERLAKKLKYVDLILGTHQFQEIGRLVSEIREGGGRRVETEWRKGDAEKRFYDVLPAEGDGAITQPMSIIEGCDKVCTFCIVPYTRGREISRPVSPLLEQAGKLVQRGVREITLLGQNVNSYGKDLKDGTSFAGLLEAMCGVEGLERIRFTTSHPMDFGDDVIRVMAAQPKICKHLHFPVQSGSDAVLRRMKRGHDLAYYIEQVDKIRSAMPDLRLSTDLIVGFPGETDADFQATLELIGHARFDTAFSFKFSPRPGTAAARMEDDVSEGVKQDRLEILQNLIRQQSDQFMSGLVGTRQSVLVENLSRKRIGDLAGRTQHNIVVNFPGRPDLLGKMVWTEITKANPNSLYGDSPAA